MGGLSGRSFRFFAETMVDADAHFLSDRAFRLWIILKCAEIAYDGCFPADDELAWYVRLKPKAFRVRIEELIAARFVERGPDGRIALIARRYENYRLSAIQWSEIRSTVFQRDNYTCTYCGERGGRLECDHIHPLSKGGSNEIDNLTTSCFKCNRSKHAKTLADWRPNGAHSNN